MLCPPALTAPKKRHQAEKEMQGASQSERLGFQQGFSGIDEALFRMKHLPAGELMLPKSH